MLRRTRVDSTREREKEKDPKQYEALKEGWRQRLLKRAERERSINQIASESRKNRRVLILYYVVLPILIAAIWLIVFGLDVATGADKQTIMDIASALSYPSEVQMANASSTVARLMANIFAAMISLNGFVLQMSIARFGPRIRILFFRHWVPLLVVSLVTGVLFFALLTNYVVNADYYIPRFTGAVSLFAGIVSLLSVFPYFMFLFSFLDPVKIVRHASHTCVKSFTDRALFKEPLDSAQLQKCAVRATKSIEILTEIGRNATIRKETNISHVVLNNFAFIIDAYLESKSNMVRAAFLLGE